MRGIPYAFNPLNQGPDSPVLLFRTVESADGDDELFFMVFVTQFHDKRTDAFLSIVPVTLYDFYVILDPWPNITIESSAVHPNKAWHHC